MRDGLCVLMEIGRPARCRWRRPDWILGCVRDRAEAEAQAPCDGRTKLHATIPQWLGWALNVRL